ncbi:MAG: hypothetical protein OEY24_08040 [Candidatus Bathyarchaeota archaeon]|nr:hypothetical protein [Candidatus Bathyarchaeota archaeon]MDH5495632.1 hypothetical protein [Candidatus Bathyarchaeota archaeon]
MKKSASFSILTLILIAGLALAFDVQEVLAEQREVGVEVGDWATYDVTVNYTTNDPDPPIPPPPLGAREIESYKAEVESVSGTNITFQVIIRFNNGTETSWRMVTDVASTLGHSFPTLFIAANLSAGDTIYKEPHSPVINATLTRRYAEAERKVNYWGQESNWTSPYRSIQQVIEMHLYWDRATGICDEWIDEREITKLEQGFVTYMFTGVVIKETNVWEREVVNVDTKFSPSILNLRSRGTCILAFLRLPTEYTNQHVDISSILLNGTVSPRAGHKTKQATHLMVKFDRQAVIELILTGRQPDRFGTVTLTITGSLRDGTQFQGSDTIKIIMRIPTRAWRFWRYVETLQIFPT